MSMLAQTALKRPLPPLVPGLPLVGHALTVLGDPLPNLVRYYRQYGPVFRLRIGLDEWVTLAGADAMREANRLGHEHLIAKPVYQGFAKAAGSSQFLLANDGPPHAHVRRMFKPIFHRDFLLPRLPEVVAATRDAVQSWPEDRPFDVVWALKDMVTRQLGIALTGIDPKDYVPELQRLLRNLVMVEQLHVYPRFLLRLPAHKRAYRRVREFCDRVVQEHRARPSSPEQADLVDALFSATRTDGAPLEDADLYIHTVGAFLAGLDTVAISVAFALYALHKHAECLPAILAEVDRAFDDAKDGPPDVRKLPELHAALLEVLRRYPLIIGVVREVARPFSFQRYEFESGRRVLLAVSVSHFLSEFYREPERFDPARMKPPRSEHKRPFAFGPFGIGPHTCLGATMGELQILITVATLLRCARFELAPRDYELKIRIETVRRPARGFRMRMRTR